MMLLLMRALGFHPSPYRQYKLCIKVANFLMLSKENIKMISKIPKVLFLL